MTTIKSMPALNDADVRDIQDGLQLRALAFIDQRYHGHTLGRTDLLALATGHLHERYGVSIATAGRLAAQALCEYESRRTHLSVDINQTTSYMLVISDSARNVKRIFSMADIQKMLSTAELAPVRTPSYVAAMSGAGLAH